MVIADDKTFCEGCNTAAIYCDFSHIVEAFEITRQLLCDDCWLAFCNGTLEEAIL